MILAFRTALLAEETRYYAKAIAGARQCECLGTYFCKGLDTYGPFKLIGGIARGHPNREEVTGAVLFFRRLIYDEGESVMNVTYEHKPEMTLIGFSTTIRPEEGYIKCPQFWDEEYARKYARLWQTMRPETPLEKAVLENNIGMFAICNEQDGGFDYWIAGLYQGGEVPEGLKLYTFPESDWALFSAKGPLPGSLQALNTRVWQEWYPTEGQNYLGNGNAMLEVYSAGDMQSQDYECGIWVPICKPEQKNDAEIA